MEPGTVTAYRVTHGDMAWINWRTDNGKVYCPHCYTLCYPGEMTWKEKDRFCDACFKYLKIV